jgi:hypothetical protein
MKAWDMFRYNGPSSGQRLYLGLQLHGHTIKNVNSIYDKAPRPILSVWHCSVDAAAFQSWPDVLVQNASGCSLDRPLGKKMDVAGECGFTRRSLEMLSTCSTPDNVETSP